METKTQASICANGIENIWNCNFDASVEELREIFMTQIRLDIADDRSLLDPDESPPIVILRIAFHLVYKAFLTGNRNHVQPALDGLDNAQTLIDDQRKKYLNAVESAAESIPVLGGLLGALWSPVQALTNKSLDATGLRVDTTKYGERMVQCALAAEALSQLYRCALLFMSGKIMSGLQAAHKSYRNFLALPDPDNTESNYVRDAKNFGLGFWSVLLSYLPAVERAGFNAAALSTGVSREVGLSMLEACMARIETRTILPTVAVFGFVLLDLMRAASEGTVVDSVRQACLSSAYLRLKSLPNGNNDNVFADWFLAQIHKRNGEYDKCKQQLMKIMHLIGPRLEGKEFTMERNPAYSVVAAVEEQPSTRSSVHRIRLDLAGTLLVLGEYSSAVAVLEPLCSKGSTYVARGMALMMRAGALAQIDMHDTAIQRAYDEITVLGKEDKSKKSMLGATDGVLTRKVAQDAKRVDKRLALFDMLYIWGHISDAKEQFLHQINTTLNAAYGDIKVRFDSDPNNIDHSEEIAALHLLRGIVAQYLKDDATCEEELRKTIELAENHNFLDPYHIPNALFELGMMYFRQGNTVQAKEAFTRVQNISDEYINDRALPYRAVAPLNILNGKTP